LDEAGKPHVDMDGIIRRMKNGYGLDEENQGSKISKILGIKPKSSGFSISNFLGF
jgi:hypothetical protein